MEIPGDKSGLPIIDKKAHFLIRPSEILQLACSFSVLGTPYYLFFFFFLSFLSFRAAPVAYGASQARG